VYQNESPESRDNPEEALRLWRHVFGGEHGLLHLFTGVREGDRLAKLRETHFNYPNAAKAAVEWAQEKSDEDREVYFCAHLLTKPRRTKENAAAVRTLWGELDGAALPNGDLRPTAVVESSPERFHGYWRLTDSIPPETAERLNKRLGTAIGADPSGFDLSQLLRVPATVNHKYPEHPMVRLLELDGSRDYSARELEERLPSLTAEGTSSEATAPVDAGDEPPVRLEEAALKRWRGEVVERKENEEIDRSRSLSQIAWALAHAGASKRIIAEALRDRDAALGFNKYVARRDTGKAYRDLAQRVYHGVETPEGETGDEPFKPISRLSHSLKNLPDPGVFPVDALPEGCRQLVLEGSKTIGCPPDFLAAPMLATLGSAIGESHVIEIIQGWTEAPALWVATVGHPGARKTPPAREAKRPVAGYQARLRKEHREQMNNYEQEEREEPPKKAAAYVDDITTESLIVTLDESPRGVIQFKDELLGLIRGLDQYKGGKGSDRQFYLSGWSGEPYAYRRKGTQEDVLLPRPFLSVVGSIQTDLVQEIADGREDGLADRFLYLYPERVRARLSEEEKGITDQARKSYAALYMRLRELDFDGEDEYGHPQPRTVKPSPEAKRLLRERINALRDEAELPGFPSRLMWVWPKLEAYLARLALILTLSRCANLRAAGQEAPLRVETGDVLRAVALLDHFKRHLRRVYALLYKADPKDRVIEDVARHLIAWGGSWSGGTATDFHRQLESENKPERPDELAKILKERMESRGDVSYHTKHVRHVKDDGTPTTRQIVRIDLLS
jgi:Protein of unknown function (DUF3987)/RepB DNA-primase from phage plasmid